MIAAQAPVDVRVRWLAARSFEIEAAAIRERVVRDAYRQARRELEALIEAGESLPTIRISSIEASPEGRVVRRMVNLFASSAMSLEECRQRVLGELEKEAS